MARWDMQKEVSQAGQTSFCAVSGELRRPLHCGRSAEAARNSACLHTCSSLFFHCLYIFSHFHAPLSPEASDTHDYHSHTAIHTQCPSIYIHSADPCADQISQPRITLSHSPSSLQRSLPTSHQTFLSFSLQASGAVCDLAECHWECRPLIQ